MADRTRVVYVKKETVPREKPIKINVEPLVVPAMIGGGLLFFYVYKDQIFKTVNNLLETIPHALDVLRGIPIYPLPPIEFPPVGGGGGNVIFDSNRHWVGKAGQTVTKFGNTGPNGKGFHAEASGNPRIRFVTPTEYELIGSGSDIHPRIYGAVNNYNAKLELDFKFNSSSVENITFKIRNRHQMGGSCENRVGGFGGHIGRNEGGLKIEKCHNIHEDGVEKSLGKNIPNGQWHRAALTVQDTSQGILQILELDGREVIRDVYKGSFAPYRNKSLFDRHSEFWIRYNGGSGSISFKNVRMRALGGTSSKLAMLEAPMQNYSQYLVEPRITVPY